MVCVYVVDMVFRRVFIQGGAVVSRHHCTPLGHRFESHQEGMRILPGGFLNPSQRHFTPFFASGTLGSPRT